MGYDWGALGAPFPAADVEWRIQQSGIKNNTPWGMVLCYVTNRAIMERLDSVIGPENWKNEFDSGPGGGVLCGLSVKIDCEWVTKWDGAENTNIDAVKGGISGAMKRAAVQWGIGRYLYKLEAGWANFHDKGEHKALVKKDKQDKGVWAKWSPPVLPPWALPAQNEAKTEATRISDGIKAIGAKLETLKIADNTLDAFIADKMPGHTLGKASLETIKTIYRALDTGEVAEWIRKQKEKPQ
jgi:hypothetical protein